jgi:hypothetical protein
MFLTPELAGILGHPGSCRHVNAFMMCWPTIGYISLLKACSSICAADQEQLVDIAAG